MIYDAKSALGADVWDVDDKIKMTYVMSVDTDAMTVTCAQRPLRVAGDEIATYQIRYRSIYAIYGGNYQPCLFHCYGRIA